MSRDTFDRWFSRTRLLEASDDRVMVWVPNSIFQVWIESNYAPTLRHAVELVFGGPRRIEFTWRGGVSAADHGDDGDGGDGGVAQQEEAGRGRSGERRRAARADGGHGAGDPGLEGRHRRRAAAAGLRFDRTFETFVVGKSNEFAHAAARAVSENPGSTYNPLFIHGGTGMGKTHLIQAIGSSILRAKPKLKVLYVKTETFTNEFIDAIQKASLVPFRKRYRQADVLLIDDIQFLAGKERSQEEFFHTFNHLSDGARQIVLTSDCPPNEIATLEARLVSRFEWGMTAELLPPDIETRMAILHKKMALMNLTVDEEVVRFIADRIKSNVRRLEGALMKVASFGSLKGDSATVDEAENLLRGVLKEESASPITIDRIQKIVAEHFDIRIADMTSKRRPANIAFPRQIAMFMSRILTKASFAEIGEAFGGKDHGTVMHACKKVEKQMAGNEQLRRTVDLLESKLRDGAR